MMELLIAIISAMLGYFLLKLDGLEKKIDLIENHILRYFPPRDEK
jgi:hypothetical protein